ncbi:hypothetical protein AAH971_08915 [Enterococcus faecalis]|uniref:hypothetical protein n=1 Tax=Enterococcus faecalis TaxID=1351 RepID=UPI0031CD8803
MVDILALKKERFAVRNPDNHFQTSEMTHSKNNCLPATNEKGDNFYFLLLGYLIVLFVIIFMNRERKKNAEK